MKRQSTDYSQKDHERSVRRHWSLRLYREYEHVCFTYRLKLTRPVIQVIELSNQWGLWDPLTRTLSLSAKLIKTYPWEVVVEILKHEIAHQMVWELYESDEAHGPCFRNCCKQLGMSEWATRAETDQAIPITQAKAEPLSSEEERLLRRVEKLLALATSSNEHEALLAMEKVQELYVKYNLDRLGERRESKLVYLIIPTKRKRIERYHFLICSILNEHFFVQVIHSTQYDARDLCDYKVIELLGTQENVLMAEYVYHFLRQQVLSLWERYRSTTRKSARAKSSYILGVVSGFRDKLDSHRAQKVEAEKKESAPAKTGWALVARGDKELENFVSYRYPRLQNIRRGRRLHDADSFDAGKEDGRRLVLHKAVNEGQGNKGKLLK